MDFDLDHYKPMPVRYELRYMMLKYIKEGRDPLPDIQGREETKNDVIRAVLSGSHPYLARARKQVAYLPGNKQAHLITDSAPNFLDGEFVGFSKALEAVTQEARLYRINDIVLNIIMLDKEEELRRFAQAIAKENIGRVAYVDTEKLGEALVEDYISSKRELLRGI